MKDEIKDCLFHLCSLIDACFIEIKDPKITEKYSLSQTLEYDNNLSKINIKYDPKILDILFHIQLANECNQIVPFEIKQYVSVIRESKENMVCLDICIRIYNNLLANTTKIFNLESIFEDYIQKVSYLANEIQKIDWNDFNLTFYVERMMETIDNMIKQYTKWESVLNSIENFKRKVIMSRLSYKTLSQLIKEAQNIFFAHSSIASELIATQKEKLNKELALILFNKIDKYFNLSTEYLNKNALLSLNEEGKLFYRTLIINPTLDEGKLKVGKYLGYLQDESKSSILLHIDEIIDNLNLVNSVNETVKFIEMLTDQEKIKLEEYRKSIVRIIDLNIGKFELYLDSINLILEFKQNNYLNLADCNPKEIEIFGHIRGEFSNIFSTVKKKADIQSHELSALLSKHFQDLFDNYNQLFEAQESIFSNISPDSNEKDLKQLVKLLSEAKEFENIIAINEKLVIETIDVLKFGEINVSELENTYCQFKVTYEKHFSMIHALQSRKDEFKNKINDIYQLNLRTINNEIQQFNDSWLLLIDIKNDIIKKENREDIYTLYENILNLTNDLDNLKLLQEFLNTDSGYDNSHKLYKNLLEDIKHVVNSSMEINNSIIKIGDNFAESFEIVNLSSVKEKILCLISEIEEKYIKNDFFTNFVDTLIAYKNKIDILSILKTTKIKLKYSLEIINNLKSKLNAYNPSLALLLTIEFNELDMIIGSSIDISTKELRCEANFNEMQISFSELCVSFIKKSVVNHNLNLLSNSSELVMNLTSEISHCESLIASPYSVDISSLLSSFNKKLEFFRDIIEKITSLQGDMLYLFGIFGSNLHLQNIFEAEYITFREVFTKWETGMTTLSSIVLLKDLPLDYYLFQNLNKYISTAENLKSSIKLFIKKQHKKFPRLLFIGDSELLELFSFNNDINVLERHINSMFCGIYKFITNQESIVMGFQSKFGDNLFLKTPFSIKEFSSIIDLLNHIEHEMHQSLLISSVDIYNLLADQKEISFDLLNGLISKSEYSMQALNIGYNLYFTSIIEKIYKNGSEYSVKIHKKLKDNLKETMMLLNLKSDTLFRMKVKELIKQTTYFISIANKLTDGENYKNNSYILSDIPKYYFDNDKINVKLGNITIKHSLEYVGITSSLIKTSLVDKIFLSISYSIRIGLGSSLEGPSGTGKTETIKYLGNIFGIPVLVFNCDENFDYFAMTKILRGICSIGAWCCFDEFNRLKVNVMSALSQEINLIQNAIKDSFGSKNQNSACPTISIGGEETILKHNTGIFLTMNPKYSGRNVLPDNISELFLPISVKIPDSLNILEQLFATAGFQTSSMISKMVLNFFLMCQSIISSKKYYDFSLRNLKLVVETAENNLVNSLFMEKDFENRDNYEIYIIAKSCAHLIRNRIIGANSSVFNNLANKYFTNLESTNNFGRDTIIDSLSSLPESTSNDLKQRITDAFIQLQNNVCGLIIIGDAYSSKSLALSGIIELYQKKNGIHIQQFIINPKQFSKKYLFGHYNRVIDEWKDGVLTHIIRNINNKILESKDNTIHYWIKFDGTADPSWMEFLNTLLDDTRSLTLPNGERIPLHNNCKIILETRNIEFLTKASLSRCVIVCLNQPSIDLKLEMVNENLNWDRDLSIKLFGFFNEKRVQEMVNFAQKLYHSSKFYQLDRIYDIFYMSKLMINFYNLTNDSILLYCTFITLVGDSDLTGKRKFIEKFNLKDMVNCSVKSIILNEDSVDIRIQGSDLVCYKNTNDILIPTVELYNLEDLIASFYSSLQKENSKLKMLLFSGPPGSGKSMIILESLKKHFAKSLAVSVNFSANYDSIQFINFLEANAKIIELECGQLKLVPVDSFDSLFIFIDEINLPEIDEYGSQQVLELLQSIFQNNGFYHPLKLKWVTLEQIFFVGACNPLKTTKTGNILIDKLMKSVLTINQDYPSSTSMEIIYSNLLQFSINADYTLVSDAIIKIVKVLLEVYYLLNDLILKNILTSKVILTPRDMTRCIWYFSLILKKKESSSPDVILSHIYQACNFLFLMRLSPDKYMSGTKVLKDVLLKHKISSLNNIENDFRENNENVKQVSNIFQSKLHLLSDSHRQFINFFDTALELNGAHVLVFCPVGFGISFLIRESLSLSNFKTYDMDCDSVASSKCFDDFISKVIREAAINDSKTALIIKESIAIKECILERLNNLLANYEFKSFFTDADLTSFIEEFKSKFNITHSSNNFELASKIRKNLFKNLKAIYIYQNISNNSEIFNVLSQALISRCIVFNFSSCSENYFVEFTQHEMEKRIRSYEAIKLDSLGVSFGPNFIKNLSETIANVYLKFSKYKLANRKKYIERSFEIFSEFVNLCISGIIKAIFSYYDTQKHLTLCIKKVKYSMNELNQMEKQLSEKKALLDQKSVEAERKLQELLENSSQAKKSHENCHKLELELSKSAQTESETRYIIQQDLDKVEPALSEAKQAIKFISKKDMAEIRSLATPPQNVRKTIESVCQILGLEFENWKDLRSLMMSDTFLPLIFGYNIETLQNEICEISDKLLKIDMLDLDSVSRANKACENLAKWVNAILDYNQMAQKVKPLKTKINLLNESINVSKARLEALKTEIKQLEDRIRIFKLDYENLISENDHIKEEIHINELKLPRCQTILKRLNQESSRWLRDLDQLDANFKLNIGNSIMKSLYISFLNSLDASIIINLKLEIKEELEKYGFYYEENLEHMLFDSIEEKESLIEKKLPLDMINISQSVGVNSKISLYKLIIDPQNLLDDYLKNLPSSHKITRY
ncbi:MAG: dynein heavy chain [Paramarteilia canceri]